MGYSVGQVPRLARITVRTLHHYDGVGLLRPSARTASDYRTYSDDDVERLQRILCYRQMGFRLKEIGPMLAQSGADPMEALRRQHALLEARIVQLRSMAAAVQKMMEARKMGIQLTPEEMLEVFGPASPADYADEAERRYGASEAWAESRRRTAHYRKADWIRIRDEETGLRRAFAAAQARGVAPTARQATDLAERHRAHIERWFYPCGYAMHRGLGDMYVADPRFAAGYEEVSPGLAGYVRDAIHANADAHARDGA